MGTVSKIESNISPVVTVKTEAKALPPAVTSIITGETDVLLVGMEYIEEIKDETGIFKIFLCCHLSIRLINKVLLSCLIRSLD